ncbi:MAG: YHYH protein [Acidimicrobiales bacterium]
MSHHRPSVSRRRFLGLSGAAAGAAAVLGTQGPAGASAAARRRSRSLPTSGFDTSHLVGPSNDRIRVLVQGHRRVLHVTSMPAHPVDPDFHYVAPPTAQALTFRTTTRPRLASRTTELVTGYTLGVHLDSVTLETASAGYYGAFLGPWNYVPTSLDRYGAHTHPVGTDVEDGDYHYHRVTSAWTSDPDRHSPIVGWAADGFPVYLRYGYAHPATPGRVKRLASSFRLRSGTRPSGNGSPGGAYDGTFVADYEYVHGAGDLDRCNGRLCVTPEFPHGIYAYFLTDEWPSVPHWLRGAPDVTFTPQDNGSQGPPSGAPPGSVGA